MQARKADQQLIWLVWLVRLVWLDSELGFVFVVVVVVVVFVVVVVVVVVVSDIGMNNFSKRQFR